MARISTLRDDFDDNVLDTTKWALGIKGTDSTIAETGGRVEVTLPANTTGGHGSFYESVSAFDGTGGAVHLEVLSVAASYASDTEFVLTADSDNRVVIYAYDGYILAQKRVGGAQTDLALAPYDPAAHRWWRMRHRDLTAGGSRGGRGERDDAPRLHVRREIRCDDVSDETSTQSARS